MNKVGREAEADLIVVVHDIAEQGHEDKDLRRQQEVVLVRDAPDHGPFILADPGNDAFVIEVRGTFLRAIKFTTSRNYEVSKPALLVNIGISQDYGIFYTLNIELSKFQAKIQPKFVYIFESF